MVPAYSLEPTRPSDHTWLKRSPKATGAEDHVKSSASPGSFAAHWSSSPDDSLDSSQVSP